MVNILLCKCCNFQTSQKCNFNTHLQSLKHINNEIEYNKTRDKEIETRDKEIEIKNIEIENLKQQIEGFKREIKLLTDFNDNYKNASASTFNYILKNYKTCPAVIEYSMKDFPAIIEEDETTFLNEVLYKHTKKLLADHLGDYIISLYKTDDPDKQPVWNSDVNRLTYIVRSKINDKSEWLMDKGGSKTVKCIVKPILNYVLSLLIKKINATPPLMFTQTAAQMVEYNDKNKLCIEIKRDIEDSVLEHDIIKYVAHSFSFNKQNEKLKITI